MSFESVVQQAIYSELTKEIPVSYPNLTNLMPSPFDPSGWYGAIYEGDIYESVTLPNPSGQSFVGRFEQVGTDQLIMADTQTPNNSIPILNGEKACLAIIYKAVNTNPLALRFRFADSQGLGQDWRYDIQSGLPIGGGTTEQRITSLEFGFTLLEVSFIWDRDDSEAYGQIFMWDSQVSGAAPIGSQIYVQAAFFGKADDWPAQYYAGGALFNNGLAPIPVYDAVPQLDQPDTDFPYVTIGEDVHTTIDTDTELMNSVSITVHVWSRYNGRSETKNIQGLIYNALHRANLTYAGYKFVTITQAQSQTMMDADGHTRHGVQTYNLMIEEL